MSEVPEMPQGGEFGKDVFSFEDAVDYVGITQEQLLKLMQEDVTPVTAGDGPSFARVDLDRLKSRARTNGWIT